MPGAARHLPALCSGASLLLCVAAAVLWARSHAVGERVSRVSRDASGVESRLSVYSADGRVAVHRLRTYYRTLTPDEQLVLEQVIRVGWRYRRDGSVATESVWGRLNRWGFGFERYSPPAFHQWETANHVTVVGLPYWVHLIAPSSRADPAPEPCQT